MPWLKLLHVAAVVIWCGALLYLPVVIAACARAGPSSFDVPRHVLRAVFIGVATPAALVAITSGSAIFLLYGPLAPWLFAKLSLVGLLVLGHGACGMLILRIEQQRIAWVRGLAHGIEAASLVWLAAIAWLVLQKPF